MGRWTDIAQWRGPTVNEGDGDGRPGEAADRMVEHRGVVIHIAAGYYEGTIAWQRNADANVSSHFVVSKTGQIAQMVDTDDRAWAQRDGNGRWLSVENEGFAGQSLTAAQVQANARILAKAHAVYGFPLQLASSPTGKGLGHHSMGAENGYDWGHSECPGAKIKAQKPAILAAAKGEDDMFEPQDRKMIVDVHHALFTNDAPGRPNGSVTGKVESILLLGEATLAAVKGVDTKAIISAVNARADILAAQVATVDEAVLEKVRTVGAAGLDALLRGGLTEAERLELSRLLAL